MKKQLNRYAEIIIHISGALILIIPAVFLLVQSIRLASKWIGYYFIVVTVIAMGIVLLESYKGKVIGKLFERNKKTYTKEISWEGCSNYIPQKLKKVEEHRKDILPENGEYYT